MSYCSLWLWLYQSLICFFSCPGSCEPHIRYFYFLKKNFCWLLFMVQSMNRSETPFLSTLSKFTASLPSFFQYYPTVPIVFSPLHSALSKCISCTSDVGHQKVNSLKAGVFSQFTQYLVYGLSYNNTCQEQVLNT